MEPRELLDLTPELFERIIAAYVNKVGVTTAWKSRSVCRESTLHSHTFVWFQLRTD